MNNMTLLQERFVNQILMSEEDGIYSNFILIYSKKKRHQPVKREILFHFSSSLQLIGGKV